ncbi:pilus assembly protein TadG-related protein [Rhizobium halophytocola]|uniref:Membrane protein n=1 Tax=Rhizobium halophytocola TaxID=735519 RepID=A0ABS4DZ58_9HYPH|nr:pilus assembly protein TadG-related protein [Rhizobium halophytocola]MBP1850972.1 putative membrane protein [Rhizobium halophytocola]
MARITATGRRLLAATDGNFAISSALLLPVVIGTLALGVDYGGLTLQRRALQQTADLAAIQAASDLSSPAKATAAYFGANGIDMPVLDGQKLLWPDRAAEAADLTALPDALARVTTGTYEPDGRITVEERFRPAASRPDAVRVDLTQRAQLHFASVFADPPLLSASGIAARRKLAGFSIGSRLASLHGGVLNAVTSALLGTKIDLDVMDYEQLADGEVSALDMLDALNSKLDLQAASYQDILDADIRLPQIVEAMASGSAQSSAVNRALDRLADALGRSTTSIKLSRVMSLGQLAMLAPGSAAAHTVEIEALDLVSALGGIAQNGRQVAVDLGATLPGLSAARVTLAIGEPPQAVPPSAVGDVGTVVRTAQTRLAVEVTGDGVLALTGTKLAIPLYLELAHAEARLSAIDCYSGGTATVGIEVVPGIVELALGRVDASAFANFGQTPRVTKAKLLDTMLIDIDAKAEVSSTNASPRTLTFTPTEIAYNTTKNVSTANALTTLQRSLLSNLDADIRLGGLKVSSPQQVQDALAETLSDLTRPIDALLYNTLLALGIKVGEADVTVNYASCQHPVLVQ